MTPNPLDLAVPGYVDRSDAVNIARNLLDSGVGIADHGGITDHGVRVLCEAVMRMDAALSARAAAQAAPGIVAVPRTVLLALFGKDDLPALKARLAIDNLLAVPAAPVASDAKEDAARYRWLRANREAQAADGHEARRQTRPRSVLR